MKCFKTSRNCWSHGLISGIKCSKVLASVAVRQFQLELVTPPRYVTPLPRFGQNIFVYSYMCIFMYLCICIYICIYMCIFVYLYLRPEDRGVTVIPFPWLYLCICMFLHYFICVFVFIFLYLCICIWGRRMEEWQLSPSLGGEAGPAQCKGGSILSLLPQDNGMRSPHTVPRDTG